MEKSKWTFWPTQTSWSIFLILSNFFCLCLFFTQLLNLIMSICASNFPWPLSCLQFSSVQSLSRVQLFVTPWIAACQPSLSNTNSQSSFKLMCIKSVMPSSHLILCHPLLRLPPIPTSIRVFSKESTLRMRWPKYWSFSFNISPSSEHPNSLRTGLL